MSCLDCEDVLSGTVSWSYYRWKTANIAMSGCKAHLKEIFEALNEAQGVANVTLTSEMAGICKEVQAIKDERDRLQGEVDVWILEVEQYRTERDDARTAATGAATLIICLSECLSEGGAVNYGYIQRVLATLAEQGIVPEVK